jgi:hypothetical protein
VNRVDVIQTIMSVARQEMAGDSYYWKAATVIIPDF